MGLQGLIGSQEKRGVLSLDGFLSSTYSSIVPLFFFTYFLSFLVSPAK